jgi:chromosome segregation ATPase
MRRSTRTEFNDGESFATRRSIETSAQGSTVLSRSPGVKTKRYIQNGERVVEKVIYIDHPDTKRKFEELCEKVLVLTLEVITLKQTNTALKASRQKYSDSNNVNNDYSHTENFQALITLKDKEISDLKTIITTGSGRSVGLVVLEQENQSLKKKVHEFERNFDSNNKKFEDRLFEINRSLKRSNDEVLYYREKYFKLKEGNLPFDGKAQTQNSIKSFGEIERTQESLEKMQKEKLILEQLYSEKGKFIDQLEKLIEDRDQQISSLKADIAPLKEKASNADFFERQNKRLEQQLQTKSEGIDLRSDLAMKEVDLLKARLVEKGRENDDLFSKLNKNEKIIKDLKENILDLEKNIDKYQKEMQVLEIQLIDNKDSKNSEIDSLRKKLNSISALQTKLPENSRLMDILKNEIDDLNGQVSDKNKALSELKGQIDIKDQHIEKLTSNLKYLQTEPVTELDHLSKLTNSRSLRAQTDPGSRSPRRQDSNSGLNINLHSQQKKQSVQTIGVQTEELPSNGNNRVSENEYDERQFRFSKANMNNQDEVISRRVTQTNTGSSIPLNSKYSDIGLPNFQNGLTESFRNKQNTIKNEQNNDFSLPKRPSNLEYLNGKKLNQNSSPEYPEISDGDYLGKPANRNQVYSSPAYPIHHNINENHNQGNKNLLQSNSNQQTRLSIQAESKDTVFRHPTLSENNQIPHNRSGAFSSPNYIQVEYKNMREPSSRFVAYSSPSQQEVIQAHKNNEKQVIEDSRTPSIERRVSKEVGSKPSNPVNNSNPFQTTINDKPSLQTNENTRNSNSNNPLLYIPNISRQPSNGIVNHVYSPLSENIKIGENPPNAIFVNRISKQTGNEQENGSNKTYIRNSTSTSPQNFQKENMQSKGILNPVYQSPFEITQDAKNPSINKIVRVNSTEISRPSNIKIDSDNLPSFANNQINNDELVRLKRASNLSMRSDSPSIYPDRVVRHVKFDPVTNSHKELLYVDNQLISNNQQLTNQSLPKNQPIQNSNIDPKILSTYQPSRVSLNNGQGQIISISPERVYRFKSGNENQNSHHPNEALLDNISYRSNLEGAARVDRIEQILSQRPFSIARLEDVPQKMLDLYNELEGYKYDLSKRNHQLSQKVEKCFLLEQEIRYFKSRLDAEEENNGNKTAIFDELDSLKEHLRFLENRIELLYDQNGELNDQNNLLRADVLLLREKSTAALRVRDFDLDGLQADNTALSEKVRQLNLELARNKNKIADLESQIQLQRTELLQLDELEELKRRFYRLQKERDELAELLALQKSDNGASKEIESFRIALNSQKNESDDLRRQIKAMIREKEEFIENLKKSKNEVAQKSTKINELTKALEKAREDYEDNLDATVRDKDELVRRHQGAKYNANEAIETLNNQKKELTGRVDELMIMLASRDQHLKTNEAIIKNHVQSLRVMDSEREKDFNNVRQPLLNFKSKYPDIYSKMLNGRSDPSYAPYSTSTISSDIKSMCDLKEFIMNTLVDKNFDLENGCYKKDVEIQLFSQKLKEFQQKANGLSTQASQIPQIQSERNRIEQRLIEAEDKIIELQKEIDEYQILEENFYKLKDIADQLRDELDSYREKYYQMKLLNDSLKKQRDDAVLIAEREKERCADMEKQLDKRVIMISQLMIKLFILTTEIERLNKIS